MSKGRSPRRSKALWSLILATTIATFPHIASAQGKAVLSLAGTVNDNAGKPVQAALVRAVFSNNHLIKTVLTNASGKFEFPDLLPGQYAVRVSKKFYQTSDAQDIRLEKDLFDVH